MTSPGLEESSEVGDSLRRVEFLDVQTDAALLAAFAVGRRALVLARVRRQRVCDLEDVLPTITCRL